MPEKHKRGKNMPIIEQRTCKSRRNSSIELLKIFGIILIVISHVIQTLHSQNTYLMANDYVLDISMATTDVQLLILALLRYSGVMGNTIFFCCSAWFLLDNDSVNKKKILQMLADVWAISIIILIIVYIARNGNIGLGLIIKQILPTTFENNWYITCYLIFYPLHPYLNWLIQKMEQRDLLRITLVLLFLYVCINYVLPGRFFSSAIVLWVSLYFTIAYMKYFLADLSNNVKINMFVFVISLGGHIGVVLLSNYLGLHFERFSRWILRWNSNCNPFLILMAISMLNIAKIVRFDNKIVNYISSLSLLIYVIHENILLRTFYRPLMWNYVYNQFGYEYVLAWMFVLVIIVFSFGLVTSIIYKNTIQKTVMIFCNWLYPILQKNYRKIEETILKLH